MLRKTFAIRSCAAMSKSYLLEMPVFLMTYRSCCGESVFGCLAPYRFGMAQTLMRNTELSM